MASPVRANLDYASLCSSRRTQQNPIENPFPFAGSIPSQLGQLTKLKHLQLFENQLTGACKFGFGLACVAPGLHNRIHSPHPPRIIDPCSFSTEPTHGTSQPKSDPYPRLCVPCARHRQRRAVAAGDDAAPQLHHLYLSSSTHHVTCSIRSSA